MKISIQIIFYIIHSVHCFFQQIKNISGGGAQPKFNKTEYRSIMIPLPPLLIQKQIVKIIKNSEKKFKEQQAQFIKIKTNYENILKVPHNIESAVINLAFLGKLVKT